jgi:hypothetical protein
MFQQTKKLDEVGFEKVHLSNRPTYEAAMMIVIDEDSKDENKMDFDKKKLI